MDISPRRSLLSFAVLAMLALSACATPVAGGGSSELPAGEVAPPAAVVGTGTVIDTGEDVKLCFVVAESYPPQCGGGVPILDWSWDGVEGSETASGITWGSYAVEGDYDGEALTVTAAPTLLALYDAAPVAPQPAATGSTDEATLASIQSDLSDELGDRLVSSFPADGAVDLTVFFDDGTLQERLDERYGENVVFVRSALRAVG